MSTPQELDRHFSELVGAVGLYLGEVGSAHTGDRDRLRRALRRAIKCGPLDEPEGGSAGAGRRLDD